MKMYIKTRNNGMCVCIYLSDRKLDEWKISSSPQRFSSLYVSEKSVFMLVCRNWPCGFFHNCVFRSVRVPLCRCVCVCVNVFNQTYSRGLLSCQSKLKGVRGQWAGLRSLLTSHPAHHGALLQAGGTTFTSKLAKYAYTCKQACVNAFSLSPLAYMTSDPFRIIVLQTCALFWLLPQLLYLSSIFMVHTIIFLISLFFLLQLSYQFPLSRLDLGVLTTVQSRNSSNLSTPLVIRRIGITLSSSATHLPHLLPSSVHPPTPSLFPPEHRLPPPHPVIKNRQSDIQEEKEKTLSLFVAALIYFVH